MILLAHLRLILSAFFFWVVGILSVEEVPSTVPHRVAGPAHPFSILSPLLYLLLLNQSTCQG